MRKYVLEDGAGVQYPDDGTSGGSFSVDFTAVGSEDIWKQDDPNVENEADYNPLFTAVVSNSSGDVLSTSVSWFYDEVSGDTKIGDGGYAPISDGAEKKFQTRFSWSDLKDAGMSAGDHDIIARVVGGNGTENVTVDTITLHSAPIDPSNVFVSFCDVSTEDLAEGGSVDFTAQVTNQNNTSVLADVRWYVGGIEVVTELVEVGINTGKEASRENVSYELIAADIGEGNIGTRLDVTAEVDSVAPP